MCSQWQKPEQGIFLSVTCKCSKYIIAKRFSGKYELMTNGVILRRVGLFDSADEAKEAAL